MKSIMVYVLFLTLPLASSAQAEKNYCENGEHTYFSCSTGKKLISICGSKELTADTGYLQYRFGTPSNLELTLPKKQIPPTKGFEYVHNYSRALGIWSIELTTRSGDFSYTVYGLQGEGSKAPQYGVEVRKKDNVIADVKCRSDINDQLLNLRDIDWPE